MAARKRHSTSGRSTNDRGQVKEAAGEILNDQQLRRQGQEEQKAAKVKRVIGQWVSGAKTARPAKGRPRPDR